MQNCIINLLIIVYSNLYEDEGNYHVYHIYSIFLKERNKLQKYLLSKNINTGNHYPALSFSKNHTKIWLQKMIPQSEKIANRQISLPIYPEIKVKMIKYVAMQINKFISNIS